jgi:hypothetical protein
MNNLNVNFRCFQIRFNIFFTLRLLDTIDKKH